MTEEEKKTVEFLKEIVIEFDKCNSEYVIDKYDEYGFLNGFRVVLNLIEKLQKENEELKEKNKTLELANTLRSYCKIDELANDFNYYKNLANAYQANSISKDKIRELIGYYKNEMKSENDLLEQKIITRKDYERRRSLHNNYIHILNKLLE